MHLRTLLAVGLVGCAAPPASTRPPALDPASAPAVPATEPDDAADVGPPGELELPPTGDRLTLARTACYGSCPIYEVSLYTSGRVHWRGQAYVSRVGDAYDQIAADAVAKLIAAAERIDASKLAPDRERAACGSDLPAVVLTLHRGESTRTWIVDASCLVDVCEGRRSCLEREAKDLKARGLSLAAMRSVAALAGEIDEAAATRRWLDDPDCRELPRELVARGSGFAAADDPGAAIRDAAYERVLAAQRRRGDVVRISAHFDPNLPAELERHRAALLARGVPSSRVVLEARHDHHAATTSAIELTVGPAKCFGAALRRVDFGFE